MSVSTLIEWVEMRSSDLLREKATRHTIGEAFISSLLACVVFNVIINNHFILFP